MWNIVKPVDCYILPFINPDDEVISEPIHIASWAGWGHYFNNIFLKPDIVVRKDKDFVRLSISFCNDDNEELGKLEIVLALPYSSNLDLPELYYTNLDDPWHKKMFYDER